MQNTWKESDINKPFKQIWSVWQLREELKLGEDIVIPEIEQAITFTREEWQKLKEDISGKEWFQIAEIIKAKLSEKIKLSTAAQESSVIARTKMRAKALKENVDKWTTDLQKIHWAQSKEILLLKVTESIESQKSSINLLKTTLVSIVQKLLVAWIKPEQIDSLSKFVSIDTWKLELNETQNAALLKLKEINSNKDTQIYNYFNSSWINMLWNVWEKTWEIKDIRDAYNSWKPIENNSIMNFVSEHPVVSGLVVAAWGYWLYKLFNAIFWDNDHGSKSSSDSENKKWDWFFDKLFEMIPWHSHWKWILVSILWIFWLGQALWNDKVKWFLKDKIWLNVDENRITKFLELLAKGEVWAAIKTLILWAEDAEKIKITKEYNILVAKKLKEECKLENDINPKLIETISQIPIKDYLASWFSLHSIIEWTKWMVTWLFSHKNPIEEKQEKAIKEYIAKQVKNNNIECKPDTTVGNVLLKIIPDTTKTMKQPEVTIEKWDWISTWAKVAALAATWATVASIDSWEKKTPEKKTDWKLEWSLGNPFLYVWMKGVRFEIGKTFTRFSIRNYISSIEWRALWIWDKALEIKELEKLEWLLQKGSLNTKEQQILEWGLEKFFKKNPNILWNLHLSQWLNHLDIIKDPEIKKWLIQEQSRIKTEAIEYHKAAEELRVKKYQTIRDWELELRKLAKDNHFSFMDMFRRNMWSNSYTAYNTKRNQILADVAEFDKKMLWLNNGMNVKLEESLRKTNLMFEKHSLPSDLRTKTIHGLYGSLESVWVTVNKVVSKVPGSWIAKWAIKLWFIWLISWSLIKDAIEWKDTVKYDLAELGFWILPISSEILDFKAALTWHDLAWRDLKSTDRWLRAWFWVVWTIADAAALVTLGQSEWMRTWMAWAKWAAKVWDIANDVWKLSKLKWWIFALAESAKFTRTVQLANAWWKILTFWALWLAAYDFVWDTTSEEIKEKIHKTAVETKEGMEWYLSRV